MFTSDFQLIYIVDEEEVLYFSNPDYTSIITPVDVDVLERLLITTNYDREETDFIVNGFRQGFDLGYQGPTDRADYSNNIPFSVGNKVVMWNKVMTEVAKGRYAGPFDTPPFKNFVQSPIGLVPKAGQNKTRLIFHLSYDFKNGNRSINHWTPDTCSVHYNDLDYAIENILKLVASQEGSPCKIYFSKSDLASAFRILPICPSQRKYLIMKAKDPRPGKYRYFVENNLPFGSSISCHHFQHFSNGLCHIIDTITGKKFQSVNYLDDFMYFDISKVRCNFLIGKFLEICSTIGFPVSIEKTEYAHTKIIFLGILLDGENLCLAIPEDKRIKALHMTQIMSGKRKATIKELQRLTGTLNFLNKAIHTCRVFMQRMYTKYSDSVANLKQYHHVNLDSEFRKDCLMWVEFLQHQSVVNRPMVDFEDSTINSVQLRFYTDASGSQNHGGFGCYFFPEWTYSKWEKGFIKQYRPNIKCLELYALCVGVFTWEKRLQNVQAIIFCDNTAIWDSVNDSGSKCKYCMEMMRKLTLNNLIHNRRLTIVYVDTKSNYLADSLSRLRIKKFHREAPWGICPQPTEFSRAMWPPSNIWKN